MNPVQTQSQVHFTQGVPVQGVPVQGIPAQNVLVQNVPVQCIPTQNVPIVNVPVQTLPKDLHQIPGAPTGLAQTTKGQKVGTVPLVGSHDPAYGSTGLAGESYAPAQNVASQGNVVSGPIGTLSGLTQTNVTPTHNVPGNTTAQGQFTFRPLEGRFVRDKDPIGKMDPYVKIKLGWHRGKTAVAQSQGTNPTWFDAITLPRKHNETFAKLKIKDKDRVSRNDRLGEVRINLDEVVQRGKFSQWYPVTDRKGNPAGEILVETEYVPLFIK